MKDEENIYTIFLSSALGNNSMPQTWDLGLILLILLKRGNLSIINELETTNIPALSQKRKRAFKDALAKLLLVLLLVVMAFVVPSGVEGRRKSQ